MTDTVAVQHLVTKTIGEGSAWKAAYIISSKLRLENMRHVILSQADLIHFMHASTCCRAFGIHNISFCSSKPQLRRNMHDKQETRTARAAQLLTNMKTELSASHFFGVKVIGKNARPTIPIRTDETQHGLSQPCSIASPCPASHGARGRPIKACIRYASWPNTGSFSLEHPNAKSASIVEARKVESKDST